MREGVGTDGERLEHRSFQTNDMTNNREKLHFGEEFRPSGFGKKEGMTWLDFLMKGRWSLGSVNEVVGGDER